MISMRKPDICPEGRRVKDKDGKPQKAKAGVAIIAKATNANILPVAICCNGPIKPGKKVTVSYGKIITPEDMNFDKEDSRVIMNAINEAGEAKMKEDSKALNKLFKEFRSKSNDKKIIPYIVDCNNKKKIEYYVNQKLHMKFKNI